MRFLLLPQHLPFDVLKIDGDFVRNFAAGPVDQLVVNAIVTIATAWEDRR